MLGLPTIRSNLVVTALALAGLLAGCDSTENTGTDDHTPTTYQVLIDGTVATAPYVFPLGQTVRVRLKFFNAANEDLDEVEGSHFGGFVFTPGNLATVVRVSDHHFQFDVTGAQIGTGTVAIGFGHDEEADENAVAAPNVTIAAVAQ